MILPIEWSLSMGCWAGSRFWKEFCLCSLGFEMMEPATSWVTIVLQVTCPVSFAENNHLHLNSENTFSPPFPTKPMTYQCPCWPTGQFSLPCRWELHKSEKLSWDWRKGPHLGNLNLYPTTTLQEYITPSLNRFQPSLTMYISKSTLALSLSI